MKLDIKIYTDATELYTLLHRSYQTYLDSLDLSFNTEVRNLASSQHKEVIESAIATVNENVKNTDQKLLSKRDLTTSQKHSFLEELHEKAIAIYYGNENIVNLSCSSQVYRPLIICQCDSLPYLHCYIYIGNNRKKRKNGFCPLTSAHSAHEVNQKTIGILRPDILKSIYSPDWNKARSQAVGSYSSKNEKVQPVCSRCGTKADKLLPSAIVAAIRSRKDKGLDEIYRCRHCQAKEARTIAKKKRKKISDDPQLLEQYSIHNEDKPGSVSLTSSKKYFWTCPVCKKIYSAEPRRRNSFSNCSCSSSGTSTPEQYIFHALRIILNETEYEVLHRHNINGAEFDVAIKNNSNLICIEYDGYFFHKEKITKDIEKSLAAIKHSNTNKTYTLKVIRLLEPKLFDETIHGNARDANCKFVPLKTTGADFILQAIESLGEIDSEIKEIWESLIENNDNYKKELISKIKDSIKKYNPALLINPSKDDTTFAHEFPGVSLILPDIDPAKIIKNGKRYGTASFNSTVTVDLQPICEAGEQCRCLPKKMKCHKIKLNYKETKQGINKKCHMFNKKIAWEKIMEKNHQKPKKIKTNPTSGMQFAHLLQNQGFKSMAELSRSSNVKRRNLSYFVWDKLKPTLQEYKALVDVLGEDLSKIWNLD